MGEIYIIKNKINSSVYIGKTCRCYKQRWKDHIRKARAKKEMHTLHRAINKYGEENFYIEVLEDNVPDDRLGDRERFYIKKYNSFRCGYNETVGGEGESMVDSDLIIDLYNRGYTYTQIRHLTGYSRETISSHVRGSERITRPIRKHAIGRECNNGKKVRYNGEYFESHRDLAKYLLKSESRFKNTMLVSVENYVSRHSGDGVFAFPEEDDTYKKQADGSQNFKSIRFMGTQYESYKSLAEYLIENYNEFNGCKVNTVIQGISYSVNKKKPYKKIRFYTVA